MWILQWMPYWVFYILLIVGIIGFFVTYLLKFFPFPSLYVFKNTIQIISLVLITIGVYMSGSIANEESWQLKIKELEVKLAEAELKSEKVNVQIVEKIVNKKQIVREQGKDIIKFVEKEVVKFDDKCVIPNEAIEALNRAAEGIKK